jgi:FkbM family methyltransferase
LSFVVATRDMASARALALLDRVPAGIARAFTTDARVARLLRPLVNRIVPRGETVVSVRSGAGAGIRLPIDARTEKFYWTGMHERPVQDALARTLRPGMTVWDVGAHIGFFSALASRLVGPTGVVHAFEPLPANRERLARTLELNACADTVVVHPLAVGAASGSAVLHSHAASTMWSLTGTDGGISVDVRSLDDLVEALGAPDLVKLDIEGVELAALAAAERLLSQRTTRIVIEAAPNDAAAALGLHAGSYDVRPLSHKHSLLEPR